MNYDIISTLHNTPLYYGAHLVALSAFWVLRIFRLFYVFYHFLVETVAVILIFGDQWLHDKP